MRLVFFDVETTTVKEDDDGKEQVFRLATANHCVYRPETGFKITKQFQTTSKDTFQSWLLEQIKPKNILYCLTANVWFDLDNTKVFTWLIDMGFEPVLFYDQGWTYIIKLKSDYGTIVFLNMQQLIPVGVEKYGEMIGLKKLEADFDDPDDDKMMLYCQRDTDIITRVFEQWLEFIRINDLGKFSFTLAGQAFTAFRYRFMKKKIYIHAHRNLARFERKAYSGGRTEAFRYGKLRQGMIYSLDINSMYPYIMKTEKMPYKFIQTIKAPPVWHLSYLLWKYNCIAYIRLRTDEPAYPLQYQKRLCFPVGNFDTYLAHPELEYAYEHGHILAINYLLCYKKTHLFVEYVDFFYKLKQQYQAEKNEAYRFMTKRLMNSLYGKFGQKVDRMYFEDTVDKSEYSQQRVFDPETGKTFKQLILGFKRRVYEEKIDEYSESFVPIPAHITSASRLLLWSLIKKAGRENVFYCDTDSLFVNSQGYLRLKKEIHPDRLGALSIDKKSRHVEIFGAKDYVFGDEVVIKGVKKGTKPEKDGSYNTLQFPGFKGAVKRGLKENYIIRKINKTLTRKYTKGIKCEDGTIEPYEIMEF